MSKRCRCKEDVLPVELIHHIQSLLPMKEAAKTCILSKSWLHAWYTIPTLKLIPPEPDKWYSTDEKATTFNKLIQTTLQRYHRDNVPIESFHLCLNIKDYLNQVDVKNWIQLVLSKSCLKELSLDIGVFINDSLTLPNELFSGQNLHTINIAACSLLPLRICTNPPVINCVSLRILVLEHVIISEEVLNNLLSACTLLEKIKLKWCGGLKNVKVKNLLRLTELDIYSTVKDDLWEINNVPSLYSFRYRHLCAFRKLIPFQMDSLASVTRLCIEGDLMFDNSFFDTLESKFPVLQSLTLVTDEHCKLKNLVFTSASLKWLTLGLYPTRTVVNVQVYAPQLLSFIYNGIIPSLLFRTTAPKQVKLTFDSKETLGHSYFLKIREALNLSSKFEIYIRSANLDSVVQMKNIHADDLRRRVSFPVGNVQLTLETSLDEHIWKKSQFFDALFLICHPSYIRSSYQVIRKMMEGKTTDLKEVLLKNPHNEKWEALTSSSIRVYRTFRGHLECKLNWFPQ